MTQGDSVDPGAQNECVAELEREIAAWTDGKKCFWGGGNDYVACMICHQEYDYRKEDRPPCKKLTGLRAELSRLRNEQPKGGDAYAGHTLDGRPFDDTDAPKQRWRKGANVRLKTMRPFEFFGTVYEQNSHAVTVVYDDNKLATFHVDDLIEQETPSPATSPEPQDVRGFDAWWNAEGQYLDPDTDDVPWFDKRKDLCALAWSALEAAARAKSSEKGGAE
jgi:hypothetical protein